MCLDVITERYKRPTSTEVVAFKGLRMTNGILRFPCQGFEGDTIVPVGKWIRAELLTVEADNEEYESGFHVYADSDPHLRFGNCLVKVKVRGVTCKGIQGYENVLVAREMFVPKPRKPRKGK